MSIDKDNKSKEIKDSEKMDDFFPEFPQSEASEDDNTIDPKIKFPDFPESEEEVRPGGF